MNKQIQSDIDKPEFDSQDAPLTDEQIAVPRSTLTQINEAMNYMGDVLNGMDAVEDEDIEKTEPAFEAIRALLAQAQVKTESTYSKSQLKMIERAIVGLRDGWATRKDADDALAILASDFAAPVSAPQPKTDSAHSYNSLAGSLDVPTECKSLPAWISVDDRLPEEETPVLIMRRGEVDLGELCWERPSFEDVFPPFQYWDRPNDDGQGWEWDEITHWMHLPSAPTEPLYGASTEPRQAPQATCNKQDLDLCAPSDKEPT